MKLISSKVEQIPNMETSAAKLPTKPQAEIINFFKEEEQINIEAFQSKSEEFEDLTGHLNNYRPSACHTVKEPPMLKQSKTTNSNMENAIYNTIYTIYTIYNTIYNAIVRNVSKNDSTALQTRKAPTEVMPRGDLSFNMHERTKHSVRKLKKYLRSELPLAASTKIYLKRISQVNEVFFKCLSEIHHEDPGNIDLRELVYRDWLKILIKVNQYLFINMRKLESDAAEKLKSIKLWDIFYYRKKSNELIKFREDINFLIKVIQTLCYVDKWDIKELILETRSSSEIFDDINKNFRNEAETIQTDKLYSDVESRKKLKLHKRSCYRKSIENLIAEFVTEQKKIESLKKRFSLMKCQEQNMREELKRKKEILEEIKRLNSIVGVAVPKLVLSAFFILSGYIILFM
uniref:Uncharacterized protein n=1 Tax=Glossina brevipalpis TaxID=37001 RepID=A0A1A9X1Z2_9MUSC